MGNGYGTCIYCQNNQHETCNENRCSCADRNHV